MTKYILPYVKQSVSDAVTMARQANVRLLLATQHPGQISPDLLEDLSGNSQFKAFFRYTGMAKQKTADYIASHQKTSKVLDLVPYGIKPKMRLYAVRWDVRSPGIEAVVANCAEDESPYPLPWPIRFGNILNQIADFQSWCTQYNHPFYLHTGSPQRLEDVLRGLPDGVANLIWEKSGKEWHGYALIEVPPPPPAPDWDELLTSMKEGQAIIITGEGSPTPCAVTYKPLPDDAPEEYIRRSRERYKHQRPVPKPEPKPSLETEPPLPSEEGKARRETRSSD